MTIQVESLPVSNSHGLRDRDDFLTGLLNQVISTPTQEWLQELRAIADHGLRYATIPTTRNEEWRFTDLSALRRVQFHVDTQLKSADISAVTLPEAVNSRLVFVNGVYAPDLSAVADLPPGVVVGNLAGMSPSEQERVKPYLAKAEGSQEVFTALNTAGISDAAVLWVGKNVNVEKPIHLLFLNTAGEQGCIYQPRCLVVAESSSSITLVEDFTFTGFGNGENTQKTPVYLTNAVTEIWLGDNAQVNHTRLAREGVEAFHVGKTAVTQARDSRYTCHAVTFGGQLSRHNLEVFQTGEQTETILNGLTMISQKQLADTHSVIALNHPHGTSRQLHKCIVSDRAHGVFNGKVLVPQAAQLTDAGQLNRNLLLSPQARVDTKPQLEITADNVKCAHGATVSQLEDDEIFYLQSRGINQSDGRKLLINAFAAEIINHIPVKSLQKILLNTVNSYS
jgi:Fe-S cluster assembly protein SufD